MPQAPIFRSGLEIPFTFEAGSQPKISSTLKRSRADDASVDDASKESNLTSPPQKLRLAGGVLPLAATNTPPKSL
jgi:hypothetical protein